MEIPPVTRADFLHIITNLPEYYAASKILNRGVIRFPDNGPLHDVQLTMDFVTHTLPQDVPKDFDLSIRNCDVFIPEWESWTLQDELFFNEVSNGTRSTADINNFRSNNPYFIEELHRLRGSHRLIKILDIPQGDPLDVEYTRTLPLLVPDYTQNYDTHMMMMKVAFEMYASWNIDREAYIIGNLMKLIPALRQSHPTRLDQTINIYSTYGSVHTGLYHMLHHIDENAASEKFPIMPFRYLPGDEALRRFMFASNHTDPKNVKLPDNHLWAQVVMEGLLSDWFYRNNVTRFGNSAKAEAWFRDIIDLFNKDGDSESRALWDWQQFNRGPWNRHGQTLSTDEMLPQLREKLADLLRKKGVNKDFILSGLEAQTELTPVIFNVPLPQRAKQPI